MNYFAELVGQEEVKRKLSFYLSIKGAHRLVDNTGTVKTAFDSTSHTSKN